MKQMGITITVDGNKTRVVLKEPVDMMVPWTLLYLSRYMKDEGKLGMAHICARAIANDQEREVQAVLLEAMKCSRDMK